VLCATALGESVFEAQQKALKLAEQIRWTGCFYRRDIGYRAVEREQQK
jgi:phosphoribosylamine--glycine ligase